MILLVVGAAAPALALDRKGLAAIVEKTRAETGSPALGALVWRSGKTMQAVSGVRIAGRPEKIQPNDAWHIGSNGKAMTATLVARDVDAGRVSFDTPLAVIFPDLRPKMAAGWEAVTLRQLLSHTAGVQDPEDWVIFDAGRATTADMRERRRIVLERILALKLAKEPGTATAYSNLGLFVAGAAAEKIGSASWEERLEREVFVPLKLTTAGYGAPGVSGSARAPRGHALGKDLGRIPVDPRLEAVYTPPEIGPAGDVHISLGDWLRFALLHLEGAKGVGRDGYLSAATLAELYKHPPGSDAAGLGWSVRLGPDGKVERLAHNGSNDYWYALIRIYPKTDTVILVVANDAQAPGSKAVNSVNDQLEALLKAEDEKR